MKNVILVGLVAFGLVACGAKEEAVVVEEAAPVAEVNGADTQPAAEAPVAEAVPAETGGVPVDAAPVVQ